MLAKKTELAVCASLVLAVISIYWQVYNFDFINLDDNVYITDNPYVTAGLTPASISAAFTKTPGGLWLPLTWLSFMLDYEIFGLWAGGYHLVNVLLHILNSLLLFVVCRSLTGALWQSAFVAALFSIHPLHAESVAWIAERKDVLSSLFFLLSLYCYTYYIQRPCTARYLSIIICFSLGLMAKPMVLTLPLVMLLLDFWPLKRLKLSNVSATCISNTGLSPSALITEKLPLLIMTAIAAIVTFCVQLRAGAVASFDVIPISSRLANAVKSYAEYLTRMLWPSDLAVLYPYPESISWLQVSGSAAVLFVISAYVVRSAKTRPYLVVGWLWYLITLFPVIGVAQSGPQAMADRFIYIPLIGIYIMLAWHLASLAARFSMKPKATAAGAAILLLTLTFLTWRQVGHWKNSITLFQHTITVTVNNHIAHYNLGSALEANGRFQDALHNYTETIRINPLHAKAHNNIGALLEKQGRLESAINKYRHAVRLRPTYTDAHYNLASALAKIGQKDDAIRHYRQALHIRYNSPETHYNLGLLMAQKGQTAEALRHYREALRLNSAFTSAHINLGVLLDRQGFEEEALQHYQEAIQQDYNSVNAHYNLGVILARRGNQEKAVNHYREAIRLQPDYARAHNNLGGLLYQQGNLRKALICFQNALAIQPDYPSARKNLHMTRLLLNKTKP